MHSLFYELYLAFVLLLDQLTYAIMNFQPSSSSWVSITPNPKCFDQYAIEKVVFVHVSKLEMM
jgi:hypothetical protein